MWLHTSAFTVATILDYKSNLNIIFVALLLASIDCNSLIIRGKIIRKIYANVNVMVLNWRLPLQIKWRMYEKTTFLMVQTFKKCIEMVKQSKFKWNVEKKIIGFLVMSWRRAEAAFYVVDSDWTYPRLDTPLFLLISCRFFSFFLSIYSFSLSLSL